MAQLMSNMNTGVFKLPLGMIRLIEFPMAILAFATTSGYSSKGSFSCACPAPVGKKDYPIEFGYSFGMSEMTYKNSCDPRSDSLTTPIFSEQFVSQSEFFVFTGVMSFLFILAIVAGYLFFWSIYENDPRFPMGDFIATAVLTLFWFAGSCAWASGVNGLKTVASKAAIQENLKSVCSFPMTVNDSWNFASLNVSLIAGFAMTMLFVANLWFIYKETAWFKARSSAGAGGPQPGMPPPTGATPTTPNQPVYR